MAGEVNYTILGIHGFLHTIGTNVVLLYLLLRLNILNTVYERIEQSRNVVKLHLVLSLEIGWELGNKKRDKRMLGWEQREPYDLKM